MLGSLAVLVLPATGSSAVAAYGWASLIAAVAQSRPAYVGVTRAFVFARDPEMSTSLFVSAVAITLVVGCLVLYVANLILWREAWPLLVAFSVQLAWGLFLFARVLTQRN